MLQELIGKVVAGRDLSRDEAVCAADAIVAGEATAAQTAALLVALRMKGETVDEIAGFVQAMRRRMVPVRPTRRPLLDTCGTGGSACRVFNVSTAAAFVAAAAGIGVAKHGNRAMSGVCGSADVLEALGVRLDRSTEQLERAVDEVGVAFLFAQQHHPAMKHVAAPRREIGVRTLFNLAGPLSNPAGAHVQVMGVYDARLCDLAALTLRELGTERALVVHGEPGLDEISTLGRTRVSEVRDGEIQTYELTPRDLGLNGPMPHLEDIAPAPTPAENAQIVRDILSGQSGDAVLEARRDLVAVNAGAALRAAGMVELWPDAVALARDVLISGDALTVLDRLIAFTNREEGIARDVSER